MNSQLLGSAIRQLGDEQPQEPNFGQITPPQTPPDPLKGQGESPAPADTLTDLTNPTPKLNLAVPPKINTSLLRPSNFDDMVQQALGYHPDADLDEALASQHFFQQYYSSDLRNQAKSLPADQQTALLNGMVQASNTAANGTAMTPEQIMQGAASGLHTTLLAAPQPETLTPEQVQAFARRMYPDLPQRTQLSEGEFVQKALLAAAVGGQNFGGTLAQMLQMDQAQRDAQDKWNLMEAAQGAGQARVEYDAASQNLSVKNAAALQSWKAQVEAGENDLQQASSGVNRAHQDQQFWFGQFDQAHNPGEVIEAAAHLGKQVAYDAQGNVTQRGTDPAVWQNLQQLGRSQKKEDFQEATQQIGSYASGMAREVQGFGSLQNMPQWEVQYSALKKQFPGMFIPAPVGGPSLAQQRYNQQQTQWKAEFGLKNSQAVDQHLKRIADLESESMRLQLAMEGAGPGGAGSLGRNRAAVERQIAMDKSQVDSTGYAAQASSYQTDLQSTIAERDALRSKLTATPITQRRDVENQLARLNTAVKDLQGKVSTSKANSQSSSARYNQMIQSWGADGSKGLPSSVQETEIPSYLNPAQVMSDLGQITKQIQGNPVPGGGQQGIQLQPVGGGSGSSGNKPVLFGRIGGLQQGTTKGGTPYRVNN